MRYKDGDANVRSVWLCSRNDAIGNVAVMFAAAAVWGFGTAWPDIIVALIMAGLFLYSSAQNHWAGGEGSTGPASIPDALASHGHAHEPGVEHAH